MKRDELIAICAASIFAKVWNGEDTGVDNRERMLRARAIKHAKAIVDEAWAEDARGHVEVNHSVFEGV